MSTTVRSLFAEWSTDFEENPNGMGDILESPIPLMRDPGEDFQSLRAALPGEDPSDFNPLWDGENPYTTMMPSKLVALLQDPNVQGMQRKRVAEAYMRIQRLEGGGRP